MLRQAQHERLSSEQVVASRARELGLLLLLTLTNGVVGFDRLLLTFLSPYVVTELGLSNTQLGLLASAMSLAIAISAFGLGRIADVSGRRRLIMVSATIVFSLFSALGGLAGGFALLFLARFVVGLAEGPMVPISQAVMADESAPQRRGFNMGVMQMAGAFLIGGMAGPVIATNVADALGWRTAFFLSALPGLLLALLLSLTLRDRPRAAETGAPAMSFTAALAALWRIRNMRVIIAVASLFSAWLMVQNVFLPVYLTQVKGLAPTTMGWVLGMGGLAGVAGGFLFPALSDRIGRRPVLVFASLALVVAPVLTMLLPPTPWMLAAVILIGWLPIGAAPLFCAVVPSESVPPALTTSAIGLSMGMAELIGGVAAPSIAGRIADAAGLEATFWLCIACAVGAGLSATRLTETAPARTKGLWPQEG